MEALLGGVLLVLSDGGTSVLVGLYPGVYRFDGKRSRPPRIRGGVASSTLLTDP